MFSRLFILIFALSAPSALACDLDDCTLAEKLHSVDKKAAPEDSFSWMNHDLAVARDALRHGDAARTLALVRDLDGLLRTHLNEFVALRGQAQAQGMHTLLQDLARRAGGWPLAELTIAAKGAQG